MHLGFHGVRQTVRKRERIESTFENSLSYPPLRANPRCTERTSVRPTCDSTFDDQEPRHHAPAHVFSILAGIAIGLAPYSAALAQKSAANEQVKRGEYLVNFGGCHDCHTPKKMTQEGPVPDLSRALSGHPAANKAAPVPPGAPDPAGWMIMTNGDLTAWSGPWGVSFAANLTPDASGLVAWRAEQFVQTMRTGKHLGAGRPLLPPMPWENLKGLTDTDLRAIFAYLKSLKPIANTVPQPIPPK